MIVILDLDYTLLDTAKFKDALAAAFARRGADRESFDRAYIRTIEAEKPLYDYDVDRHIELLTEESSRDADGLKREAEKILDDTAAYLYPGAREFLECLRDSGARLVLLTLGNESWQRAKVGHSGLADLFDEVVTVGAEKESVIGDITRGRTQVAVINDNADEILKMREANPSFLYILKRGPKSVPDAFDIPVCDSFEEISGILLSGSPFSRLLGP